MRQTGGHQQYWRFCLQTLGTSLFVAAFWSLEAFAQGPAADSAKPAESALTSDQQKIRELEDRYMALEHKLGDLRREENRQQTLGSPFARHGEVVALQSQLIFLYRRLSSLQTLEKLKTEMKRLEQQIKEKSDLRSRLEHQWNLKRSELLESIVDLRSDESELDSVRNPGRGLPSPVLEQMRRYGKEPRPDERKLREAEEQVRKSKDKTNSIRIEVKHLWDRLGSVRDEELEIQAALDFATQNQHADEVTRPMWDVDKIDLKAKEKYLREFWDRLKKKG
jgi:chromosome segregation ATPase